MLKKLIKAVEEFIKNDYFKSYGIIKLKLAVQEPVSIASILKSQNTRAIEAVSVSEDQEQTPKQVIDSEEE